MILAIPYADSFMRSIKHAELIWHAAADGCATSVIIGDPDASLILAHLSRFYQAVYLCWLAIVGWSFRKSQEDLCN